MQEGSLSSNKEISRRKFIKQLTVIGGISAVLPILISGDTPKIIKAIANLDSYPLTTKYLYSLTKKEGTAYIRGIYHAVKQDKIDKDEADLFLRDIFSNEDLLWMREGAIKALIKLDRVNYEELNEIIYSIPDVSVLKGIASALGNKGTSESEDHLIEWNEREKDNHVRVAIFYALGQIGTKTAEEYLIKCS